MHYEVEQDISNELNERLRMETGWDDVAGGLMRVLAGWIVMILGVTIGVGLIVLSTMPWLFREGSRAGNLPSLGSIWMYWIGLGILSVIWTFSFFIIMGGQWRCLHGASERYAAKWLMFFCITCLLAWPVLKVASGIGGNMQRGVDLQRGAQGLRDMRFSTTGRYLQVASAAALLLYDVFFLLFLRAVARCHGSQGRVMLVNFYMVVVLGLAGLTAYLGYHVFRNTLPVGQESLLLYVLGGWIVTFLFYLFLIGSVRSCIIRSMARVRSPLDM